MSSVEMKRLLKIKVLVWKVCPTTYITNGKSQTFAKTLFWKNILVYKSLLN